MSDRTREPGPDQERETEVLRRELERRLAILEKTDDAAFGRFTALDWAITIVLFVLLPLLLAWWGS